MERRWCPTMLSCASACALSTSRSEPDHPVLRMPAAQRADEGRCSTASSAARVKCAANASSSDRELIDELWWRLPVCPLTGYTISGHECNAFKPTPKDLPANAMGGVVGGGPPSAWLSRTRLWASPKRPGRASPARPRSGAASARGRQPRSIASRCRYR
ncbi:MAG: hypothetical protein ACLU37_05370 [Collinsella sp.]